MSKEIKNVEKVELTDVELGKVAGGIMFPENLDLPFESRLAGINTTRKPIAGIDLDFSPEEQD